MTGSISRLRTGGDPDPSARRRGAVYGIPTIAVDSASMPIPGRIVVGYVGQTRQTVKQREDQHRLKPFSDLIIGGSWCIEEGFWTGAELDEREQHYITNGVVLIPGQDPQRPVYNYEHNLDNPERVEIWRAVEQRQAREPGWVPPVKDSTWVSRPQAARPQGNRRVSQSPLARWWVRRRWWVLGLAGAWVALFVLALRATVLLWDDIRPGIAAVGAVAPFVLVQGEIWRQRLRAWWRRKTRPRRRYSRRGRR